VSEIREHSFRCGYAPRSIRYSLNSETLFIGCKDGTITIVTNLASPDVSGIQGYRTGERSGRGERILTARSLIEWEPRWLLIGRDDGSIDLMDWMRAKEEACHEPELLSICPASEKDRVTCLEWLDPRRLLISYRFGETRVVIRDPEASGPDALRRAFEAAWADPGTILPGVGKLIGAARMKSRLGADSLWLLISQSGRIWQAEDQGGRLVASERKDFWPVGEAPGFISDFVLVKPPYEESLREREDFDIRAQRGEGAYIATDNGVYFLRWEGDALVPLRMSLPGLGRMGISITYYADDRSGYLWVSDAAGDAHLFWDELGKDGKHWLLPNWRRSGLRHDASQVVLGSASWRTLAGDFIISQARRNDHVEIRRYRFDQPGEGPPRIPAAVGASEWHRLLQKGSEVEIRERVRLGGEEEAESWDSDALLAELFDLLGDDSESMKGLSEFLGNPTSDLARVFLKALEQEPPERSGRAVKAWTYALLGAIHHSPQSDKESLYRGIVRWLRAIAATELDNPGQQEEVRAAAEDQILFVRKWGVFGDSYAQRMSAVAPLEILIQQQKDDRRLDRYAYQTLLFHRQVDLEYEDDRMRMAGRTAWDLRTLSVGDRLLVAVSWIRGGVHLHEIVAGSRADGGRFDLVPCEILGPELDESGQTFHLTAARTKEPEPRSDDSGYSRAVVLGTLPDGGGHYLLASPAQRHDIEGPHRFELWRLDFKGERAKVQGGGLAEASRPLPDSVPREESVYSLLELEPGLALAGLRGHGGPARVVLLKIRIVGDRVEMDCLSPDQQLPSSSPEGKAITRNHVWSLALETPPAPDEPHVVFAGCGDGQVWQLRIPRYAEAREGFPLQAIQVQRLGAPVWALACRVEERDGRRVRRVFAGGADGTILALQELSRHWGTFTTVWATHEDEGSIARLHLLGESDGENAHPPMLLAVTQQGRCIFFSDRWQVEESEKGEVTHRRLRFPGERHGRPRLDAPAFASDFLVLPKGLVPKREKEGFARLISATNDGRLRVHTLHSPLYLDQRLSEYQKLVTLWLDMICEGQGEARRFKPHSLRLVEAAYVASPVAPEVLVRALLEVRNSRHWEQAPDRDTLERQWLPHYVRPLFDLHHAWNGFPAEEAQEKAQTSLELALERAWRRQDRGLFVEILAVVLQRSNFWLFEMAGREDLDPRQIQEFYGRILDALEKSMNRWLGFPDKAELLTRMSFAKQLTDGDTLWRMGSSEPLGQILSTRIAAIRRLLVFGDPLLALETLRAANVALLRVAKRLVDHGERMIEGGKSGWKPGNARHELPWTSLESYGRTLTDLAVGAFQSTQRVSDALAHEIARSFALLVCVCPSASTRVVQWMSEADLVSPEAPKEDRTEAVLRQLELLADLGAPVPRLAIDLFRWASSSSPRDHKKLSQQTPSVGRSNWQVIVAGRPFRAILDWIAKLVAQLSSDASRIDLEKARDLKRRLGRGGGESDPFHHSREFWLEALGRFETGILGNRRRALSDRIQPEVVLLSRRIAAWCEETLLDLEERPKRHAMFQPQYSMYLQALQELERAAREFPNSSAIQKNIVLGILGHGLLEALDEHVLELEEIAQALDPLLVWGRRDGRTGDPEEPGARADHFARYLLARSRDAESIPKNLRTLQGLLASQRGDPKGSKGGAHPRNSWLVKDLLPDFRPTPTGGVCSPTPENPGWNLDGEGKDISLSDREVRFLRMALKELDQNDRIYGPRLLDRSLPEHWPRIQLRPDGIDGLILRFALRPDAENARRLRGLKKQRLQSLYPRREARNVASHGTGLYLANLAASVVDWRLGIQEIQADEGWFSFLLERVAAPLTAGKGKR
jgi:hypothetical protein